jgi:hypothetical protein
VELSRDGAVGIATGYGQGKTSWSSSPGKFMNILFSQSSVRSCLMKFGGYFRGGKAARA